MLNNGENLMAYNDFSNVPYIPYKILEELLLDESEEVEKIWKLLKYPTADALKRPKLTEDEKDEMIWRGESLEQDYNIFLKPLIGSSLDTAESQTQMRLHRYNTNPTDRFTAVVSFQIDFTTNEKTCLVYDKGMICERTDLLVNLFLQVFNGRDINVGILTYDKNLSRSCQDLLSISNSKTMFGRSLIMALQYNGATIGGDTCG